MRIECGPCAIRPFKKGDEPALARHADSRAVWRNVRDRFPHPYTAADARAWIDDLASQDPLTHFAIDIGGESVGSIGYTRRGDVERFGAEVGYWLGESAWGRGLATAALSCFVPWVFATTDLERLDAVVFESNAASCRVLEKAGFEFEGRLRRSVFKDGAFADALLYARLRGP